MAPYELSNQSLNTYVEMTDNLKMCLAKSNLKFWDHTHHPNHKRDHPHGVLTPAGIERAVLRMNKQRKTDY